MSLNRLRTKSSCFFFISLRRHYHLHYREVLIHHRPSFKLCVIACCCYYCCCQFYWFIIIITSLMFIAHPGDPFLALEFSSQAAQLCLVWFASGWVAFEWRTCLFSFAYLLMVWNCNLRTELENGLKKKENGGVFETNESQVRIYTICTSKKEISDEGVGMWGHTGVITMNEEMFLWGGNGGLTKLYQLKAIYVEEKKISFCFGFCVFYKFLLFLSLQNIHIYI